MTSRSAFRIRLLFLRLFAITVICTDAPTLAQLVPVAEPESVGMSSDRLDRIGQLVRRKIHDDKLVGAVTMVARRGKLVHFEEFGKADVEADKPLRKDAIFRIYSMTKPITSVAAMMLHEEGKFQLYDPLYLYLPEFKDVQVYVGGDNGDEKLATPPGAISKGKWLSRVRMDAGFRVNLGNSSCN